MNNYRQRTLNLSLSGVLIGALLLCALGLIVAFPQRTSGDMALFLDLAGRILDGQLPNVDFYEINLPTNPYLHLLPAALARLSGADPILMFNLGVWLLCAISMLAAVRVLRRAGQAQAAWAVAWVMALSGLLYMAFIAFGQREHLFILLTLPWFALRWSRYAGAAAPERAPGCLGTARCIQPAGRRNPDSQYRRPAVLSGSCPA